MTHNEYGCYMSVSIKYVMSWCYIDVECNFCFTQYTVARVITNEGIKVIEKDK